MTRRIKSHVIKPYYTVKDIAVGIYKNKLHFIVKKIGLLNNGCTYL